ncbi:MAG: YdcF family protein, partial [Lachnospiraceae bacterium]|nr:YdcF family protein [Lachnospiraceae bacterium]
TTGNFSNYRTVSIIITIYVFVCAAILFNAYRRQVRYSIYSYNTIIYMGFGIFLLAVGISLLVGVIRLFTDPAFSSMLSIYSMLLNSAMSYMLMTLIPIGLFSLAMIISNISLIRHEGRRVTNMLGIAIGVVVSGAAVLILYFGSIGAGLEAMRVRTFIFKIIAAIYVYGECMLVGAIIASVKAAHMVPELDREYMIVLGCGIRKDGTPTPLLRGRCDKAIEFYKLQLEKTGKAPKLVASGGKGGDEVISESACIKAYLLSQGIPESDIIMEDKSTSTMENMSFSKNVTGADNSTHMAFSTTRYHVFRSGILARFSGMKLSEGIGAKTKWYFWPNAWAREFIGLMTSHRVKQALVLGLTVGAYILLWFLIG